MACTGGSPFAGPSTPRTLYNLVHADPGLTALPGRVREIAGLCLAKDPAGRPTPDELLTEIGAITPSTRPWPPAAHRLIERQHAEVTALLDGTPADTVTIAPPRDETTTMPMPAADTVATETRVVPAVRRRRWLVPVLTAVVVVAAVAGLVVWSPWSGVPATTRSPGSSLAGLDGHTDVVNELAFQPPDGDLLATASNDNTVRLWDLTSRSEVARVTLDDNATDLAFSPDSSLLATTRGETVRLWDVTTARQVGAAIAGASGESFGVPAFSPDGRTPAVPHLNGQTTLWDVTTREKITTLNNRALATGTDDGEVWVYRMPG
ncbi:hypothetical protein [Actinophytocola sp. KF-1]